MAPPPSCTSTLQTPHEPMPPQAEGPSHWIPYIMVEDVDATCAKAESLGACIYKQPDDIPHMGRFAVLGDPQGASFAVWKNAEQPGA